jgi:hypothetical protein
VEGLGPDCADRMLAWSQRVELSSTNPNNQMLVDIDTHHSSALHPCRPARFCPTCSLAQCFSCGIVEVEVEDCWYNVYNRGTGNSIVDQEVVCSRNETVHLKYGPPPLFTPYLITTM